MFHAERSVLAAWACVTSGGVLALSSHLAVLTSGGMLDATAVHLVNVIAGTCAAGLAGGIYGLNAMHEHRLGRAGTIGSLLVYIGLTAWNAGGLNLTLRPSVPHLLVLLGTAVQAIGMLILGSSVLRKQVMSGWKRYIPLLNGAWFCTQLILQLPLLISRGWHPFFTLLLSLWGALWMLLGLVVLKQTYQS